ncbi:MAG: DUF58 domain-containing protein [Myxococcales bacterium]|nr:DUF58 domain-containing protein [Myxococcales bacterium]
MRPLYRIGALLRALSVRLAEIFPWTPLGVVVSATAYAALELFAYAQLDRVWLVVGYAGLGLTLLSPAAVLASTLWLKLGHPVRQPSDALTLQTGVLRDTGFRLRAPFYLPLAQLRWRWQAPSGARVEIERRAGYLVERVEFERRGRFEGVLRRIEVTDPFGLSRLVVRLRDERAVDVLPRLGGLAQLPALSSLSPGDASPHPMGLEDGDRLELRRYGPGDPARFIHWKVLGRTGRLMVRTPERALSVARRMAAFMIAAPADDASAAVARLALSEGLLGDDWSFATDESPAGCKERGEALDALMRSGNALASNSKAATAAGSGLAAFVQTTLRRGPASFLIFAPPTPGPWLERVAAHGVQCRMRVVIGVDGIATDKPRPLWRRLLSFATAPPRSSDAAQLEQVLASLGRAGIQTTVFDRGSGRPLSATHRRAMLAHPQNSGAATGEAILESVRG